jgi:hypothetical protein
MWQCHVSEIHVSRNSTRVAVLPPPPAESRRRFESHQWDPRLEPCSNKFNEAKMTQYHHTVPLRIITFKMMLFQKLKKESEPDSNPKLDANGQAIVKKFENQGAFDDEFEGEYYVTEDKHLKEFFFDDASYKDWLKNSYQKAGRVLDSNKPPPTDRVFDMVTENQVYRAD